ncbi:MAG: alpha/beta fold hydrolase [Pseudomonadales bacterium]
MNDAVLDAVSTALKGHDIGVLRFNFRGVGGSEGHHDGGTGESEDLAAVWAWLLANEGYSPTILGGYSFGASVAWATARKLPSLERVLLVAPPLGHMRFDGAPPACPVHLIYGDRDEFVDTAAARRMNGVTHHLIAGADHFFSGRWVDLATAADTALG